MEESLKARLIGAAVLVALAVLLIPELLSGRKAADSAVAEGAGPRGTRTFTIELGQGSGQTTRNATTATAPATPPPAAATAAPAASTGPANAEEAPAQPAAEAAAPAQVEAPVAPATAAPDGAKTAAATAAPAPSAEPEPPPAITAPGGWAVQVGAFGSAETARKLVKDLGGAGYRAFISPVTKGGKTLYRVRVGPEAEKPAAEQLAQRLKGRGLPATVVQND